MGDTVLASAADRRYGWYLLNLLGSVAANSPVFDRIVVFDLGLSPLQRRLASTIRGVEVRTIPPFAPHWAEAFTWKPWIWTHLEADLVVYLDAGVTVLRSLADVLAEIHRRGYFVVSQGRPLGEIVPSEYYALYGLPRGLAERDYVAAGIIGFPTRGRFFDDVIAPTFEDCLLGRNLGASESEAGMGFGLQPTDGTPIRDCERFRHDQTILNLRLFTALGDPVIADLTRFGGWRSPHDHPQQVIWNHRRRGDFRYLGRVPYRLPTALFGVPFGLAFTARWWVRTHRWLFRPSTYANKARTIIGSRRRS